MFAAGAAWQQQRKVTDLVAVAPDPSASSTTTTAVAVTEPRRPAATKAEFCSAAKTWWQQSIAASKGAAVRGGAVGTPQDKADSVAMTHRNLQELYKASPPQIEYATRRLSELYGEVVVPGVTNATFKADDKKQQEMISQLQTVEAYYSGACDDAGGLPEL